MSETHILLDNSEQRGMVSKAALILNLRNKRTMAGRLLCSTSPLLATVNYREIKIKFPCFAPNRHGPMFKIVKNISHPQTNIEGRLGSSYNNNGGPLVLITHYNFPHNIRDDTHSYWWAAFICVRY